MDDCQVVEPVWAAAAKQKVKPYYPSELKNCVISLSMGVCGAPVVKGEPGFCQARSHIWTARSSATCLVTSTQLVVWFHSLSEVRCPRTAQQERLDGILNPVC